MCVTVCPLVSRYGISPESVILYGQSIGTVPTVDLASRYECAAVILHSALTSGMRVAFPDTSKTYCFDAFPKSVLHTHTHTHTHTQQDLLLRRLPQVSATHTHLGSCPRPPPSSSRTRGTSSLTGPCAPARRRSALSLFS